ncbi:MAG: endolytic transglycosylase MltG [Oscillospiraceae bacterium]|nr:endolytic transglycosylase MltG [Oscillospiraceae bacterium]
MNSKEFEDFFKDLEPDDIPVVSDDSEEDLVFSSFFEDETTKKAPEKKIEPVPEVKKAPKTDFEFEDEVFAPPPPKDEEEEKPVQKPAVKKAEPEKKKTPAKNVSSEAARKKKKKRINTAYNWLLTIVWVSAVLAVSIFIASFALSSINDLVGFSKESREVTVTIPEGSDLSDVANILEETGIIDEPFTFEVYARVKNMEGRLASGTFTLNPNLGYDQIFQALKTRDDGREIVKVTFYEGMKVTEIAERLDENGVCDYEEFMAAVDTETFEYEFESMMGTNEYIYHKWEGYLFPDTYEFFTDSTPRSVMAKFIDNFNNKITGEYYERMKELGMSLDEVITLASVIQSEAAYMEDMEKVSSAFHNRLNNSSNFPNLESDVTWFYYEQEIKPFVEDEAVSDEYHVSYDTYYKRGLPVGPICNPGLNAIKAALYPEDTNYYFFVTDLEGNFYYASTMAEHEANIVKAGRGG